MVLLTNDVLDQLPRLVGIILEPVVQVPDQVVRTIIAKFVDLQFDGFLFIDLLDELVVVLDILLRLLIQFKFVIPEAFHQIV